MIMKGSLEFGPAMILKGSQKVARGRSPLEDSPLLFSEGRMPEACQQRAIFQHTPRNLRAMSR
jgi:hypothetical protein